MSAQSGDVASTVVDCFLFEVCKRAATKLGITWPVTPGNPGVKRDIYGGKRLPCHLPLAKQLLPALRECIIEMKYSWDKPFSHCMLMWCGARLQPYHGPRHHGREITVAKSLWKNWIFSTFRLIQVGCSALAFAAMR